MTYYDIDDFDVEKNSISHSVAVWSTDSTCAYAEWMRQILAHGGEWEAPDGHIYSIHREEDEA